MTKFVPCSGCSRSVYYLLHERTGRRAPINATPAPNGNIEIDLTRGTYRVLPKAERDGMLFTNHFYDCPKAARFHKTGRTIDGSNNRGDGKTSRPG